MKTNPNPLRERGRSLEDGHFRKLDEERLARCRDERRREAIRRELGAELEIEDAALLDRLIDLGVTPDTAAAFEALPLLEVAWADGDVDAEEGWKVLAAATAFGLELGRPAHAQLELWARRKPRNELFEAWHFVALRRQFVERINRHARRVLEGAYEVAEATGGVLGFWPVSRVERTAIERIRATLGAG